MTEVADDGFKTVNIIAFYSNTIFEASGIGAYTALWASFGFGLINVCAILQIVAPKTDSLLTLR